MKVDRKPQAAEGIRFSISSGGVEVARAYLYLMHNDLHKAPFGLLEDVFVDESQRGGGLGRKLVQEVIVAARQAGCISSSLRAEHHGRKSMSSISAWASRITALSSA